MLKSVLYVFIALSILSLTFWLFSDIVVYIVLAMIISSILRPLVRYIFNFQLYGKNIPKIVAVLLSFCILIIFFTSFFIIFIPLISEQIEIISSLNYDEIYDRVSLPLSNLESYLINNELTTKPSGFIVDNIKNKLIDFISDIQVSNLLNTILSVIGKFFVGILSVTFISFFLLYEMGSFRKKIISLIPNKYFEVTIIAYNKIETLLSNYLTGLLIQMIAIFSLSGIGLSVMGVNYSLTIAFFVAFANLIPYMGPLLGATFGAIVGISTGVDINDMQSLFILLVKIITVFGVVQVVDNVFLQPIIFSKSIKAHPLEIFIIIFVGASIMGIVGMIFAIPMYTILKVSFISLYDGYKSYNVFNKKNLTIKWH